jgi:hypothetical protein
MMVIPLSHQLTTGGSNMKEKKLPYLDEQGNRRDPNRKGNPILCNAKSKRTQQLCGNIARANGKCRVHGGNNTGPNSAEARKRVSEATAARNFKTGEHVPIWFDMLRPQEQDMLELIPKDAAPLLEQEIMLTTVRERRMLDHIMQLEDKLYAGESETVSVQESWKRHLLKDEEGDDIEYIGEDGYKRKQAEMVLSSKLVIKEDVRRQIKDIEEALTRVQTHKAKLIELKHKLSEGNLDEEDGSLDQLVAIIGKARNLRVSMDNREEGNQA